MGNVNVADLVDDHIGSAEFIINGGLNVPKDRNQNIEKGQQVGS
jgi:hypothetical protein